MDNTQKRKALTEKVIIFVLLIFIGVTYHILSLVSPNP